MMGSAYEGVSRDTKGYMKAAKGTEPFGESLERILPTTIAITVTQA